MNWTSIQNNFITPKFTLNGKERLKSTKAIQQLFKEGKSFSYFPFRIIYIENENQKSPLQAGFTVSAKNLKKAVDRNRIKRLMRESYRLQKHSIKNKLEETNKNLAVFFIYTGNQIPEYADIYQKMGHALGRLQNLGIF